MRTIRIGAVSIRPITDGDIRILLKWRNSDTFLRYCSTRRNIVTLEQFKVELRRDFEHDRHQQCLILKDDKPIGTIFSYNLNLTDGHVWVTTFVDPKSQGQGYGARAFAMFLLNLFNSYPIFKVYLDVYSYNTASLQPLIRAGFAIEGTFHGHRKIGNRRFDLVRLAFFRSQSPKAKIFLSRLNKKILKGGEKNGRER